MRNKAFVLLALMLAATGFGVGAGVGRLTHVQRAVADDIEDTLAAKTIAVTDADGNARILMSTDDQTGAPTIGFHAPDGKVRQVMSLSENGEPAIVMNNLDGDMRFVLAVLEEGGPGVLMKDSAGKTFFRKP